MATFATPIDYVQTTLDAAYTPGQTSIAVKPGDGVLFGTPSVSAPVRFNLIAASAIDGVGRITDRTKVATFLCAGRSGDSLSALSFEAGTDQDFSRGDIVAVLVTSQTIAELQAAIQAMVSDRTFVFTQSTPSASWTVMHGLGKFPAVAVADSAGEWVVGDVTYLDANSLRIDFNGGFSGTVYLN